MENKNSYFEIYIQSGNVQDSKRLKNSIDLVLSAMKATSEIHIFKSKNEYLYLFRCEYTHRKRPGQLYKYCESFIKYDDFQSKGLTKFEYESTIARYKINKNFILINHPNSEREYKGKDIAFLRDVNNWKSWQKSLYGMLYMHNNNFDFDFVPEIKEPDIRKIIHIVDPLGKAGKSSMLKLFMLKSSKDIGRLTYGSAAQLRSAVTKQNSKLIYIIDLPRSRGKDEKNGQADLLACLEDLKTGFVCSSLYGSGDMLLQEPPHVVIISNFYFTTNNNEAALSADRWEIYKIKGTTVPNPEQKGTYMYDLKKDLVLQEVKLKDIPSKKSVKKFNGWHGPLNFITNFFKFSWNITKLSKKILKTAIFAYFLVYFIDKGVLTEFYKFITRRPLSTAENDSVSIALKKINENFPGIELEVKAPEPGPKKVVKIPHWFEPIIGITYQPLKNIFGKTKKYIGQKFSEKIESIDLFSIFSKGHKDPGDQSDSKLVKNIQKIVVEKEEPENFELEFEDFTNFE
jgi:hypothetical protein